MGNDIKIIEINEDTPESSVSVQTGENEKNKIESGTLYLVATPIGNLADLSARAEKILAGVDFIAAEDTRVTAKLLSSIGVSKPVVSYHEHNKREAGNKIAARLADGESCALVTDAGTPVISDPGEEIVRLCIDYGLNVTSVPGACAAVTALILSGLDARRFTFEGFIDGNEKQKREHLETCKKEKRTMIFYEAPHDIVKTLALMYDVFGDRGCAVCRELTKLNEEIWRGWLSGAQDIFGEREPRGEFVIVVEGCGEESGFWVNMTIPEHVDFYIDSGLSKMDAVKAVAKDRGIPKNTVYKKIID